MNVTPKIIESCRRNDRKTINRLYEYCFGMLMPICFRYNKNEEDARAAYNQGLNNVEDTINFNPWAKRIMVNSLIDEYRKNKNYTTRIDQSDSERELDYYSEGQLNDAESNLGYENIMMLVKELPATSSKVFNLYVIEGYSHKEIGALLEMSEGTSKWHLSSARKELRVKLEQLESQNQRMVI